MKNLKLLIGIAFFLIFLLIWKADFIDGEKGNCKINQGYSAKMIDGVLLNKVRNSESHSNEILYLSNNKQFEWEDNYFESDSIFSVFQIGDSIVKSIGNLNIFIFRNDTNFVINIELPCETND